MGPLDIVAERLESIGSRVAAQGDRFSAQCPAHDDRNASLSVSAGSDGRALVHCHAGCATVDVLAALGLDFRDLFAGDAPKPWTVDGLRRTGASIRRDGRVQLGGVGYLPGAGNAQKTRAVKGQSRDLWPDPATVSGETLYVVEGEPDAQTGAELGLPVVGVPGAAKWTDEFAARLARGRRRVVVIPDADDPGRNAARRRAADLTAPCSDVRVLDLYPSRQDGSDLSTFAAGVTTADERHRAADLIRRAVDSAAPVRPEPAAASSGGSLPERLAEARVDLLAYLDGELAEREWLPCSANMLARGARHHVAAPLKSGKSLAFLAHAVDMTIAGARVAILDRENGAPEYARRLRDVLASRPGAREAVRDHLAYFAWPALKLDDGAHLANALGHVDLVVIDSTRTFLSALSLDENGSDDFATFATAIIEPLFRARIATLQLDNTGHGDSTRARGSSTKGDLADVLYSLKTVAEFDHAREGRVRLKRERSRFGDVAPSFTMTLGAGAFGRFTADSAANDEADASLGAFRPTGLMQAVSEFLEHASAGASKNAIEEAVRGRREYVRQALALLVAEGFVSESPAGRRTVHRSVRPFRESDLARSPRPRPDLAPGAASDPSPVRPPLKGAKGEGEDAGLTAGPDVAPGQEIAA